MALVPWSRPRSGCALDPAVYCVRLHLVIAVVTVQEVSQHEEAADKAAAEQAAAANADAEETDEVLHGRNDLLVSSRLHLVCGGTRAVEQAASCDCGCHCILCVMALVLWTRLCSGPGCILCVMALVP